MHIEFPNAAREDFLWSKELLRVGSAADNDLVLASHQASSHHLRLQQDRRGIVLQVLPQAGRVYVNARPVRERALLRPGDVLSVGDCRMLLRGESSQADAEPADDAKAACPAVSLRAVAGPWSGRVWPVATRLRLGLPGGLPLDLPQGEQAGFEILWTAGQLRLNVEASSRRHPLRINGIVSEGGVLRAGDQLGLAHHRFVLDAPGLQPEPVVASEPAATPALPEEAAGPRGEVWWLIFTAALLALGIAMVLLIRL